MPEKRNNQVHVESHRVLLPREQMPLASPMTYHFLKLWPCRCSNVISHGVTGHLFSAASFLPNWEAVGNVVRPVIPHPVQWDIPQQHPSAPISWVNLLPSCAKLWTCSSGKTQPWLCHGVVLLQREGLS